MYRCAATDEPESAALDAPKPYHLELEERNGEQEHSYDFLIYTEDGKEAWEIARDYARTFYGADDNAAYETEKNVFEFMYGCIIVEITGLSETTKDMFVEHFLVRCTVNPPTHKQGGITW